MYWNSKLKLECSRRILGSNECFIKFQFGFKVESRSVDRSGGAVVKCSRLHMISLLVREQEDTCTYHDMADKQPTAASCPIA